MSVAEELINDPLVLFENIVNNRKDNYQTLNEWGVCHTNLLDEWSIKYAFNLLSEQSPDVVKQVLNLLQQHYPPNLSFIHKLHKVLLL